MRLCSLNSNDVADSDNGSCVSIWFQGCPHHCKGCHNPETWGFTGGHEVNNDRVKNEVSILLDNLYLRTGKYNLSILGGEPLCEQNIPDVYDLILYLRSVYKNKLKIYCWSGYYYKTELKKMVKNNNKLKYILNNVDVLVDGRFILEKRDTTLKLRGSSNQNIWIKKRFLNFTYFTKDRGN